MRTGDLPGSVALWCLPTSRASVLLWCFLTLSGWVGRLPAYLLRIRCGGGAAPGRVPCDLGGREEPISRARGGQCLFTQVILEHSPKVPVFSLKKKAARHRQQRPSCSRRARCIGSAPQPRARTNPRTQAAARSRARRLRMHVTTCSLSLD